MMVDFTAFRNALQYPSLSEMAHDTRIMTAARVLVAYYYYFLAFLSVLFLTSGFLHKVNFDPFWPLSWSSWLEFDFATTVLIVKLFFLAAAFLSLLFHNTWWSRLLIFIAIWQVHALESSFGSMNHHWYGWLYTSLIFVFLPNVWRDESWNTSRTFLLSIWFAQASVALLYTLAGIHKLITALEQFSQNENTWFINRRFFVSNRRLEFKTSRRSNARLLFYSKSAYRRNTVYLQYILSNIFHLDHGPSFAPKSMGRSDAPLLCRCVSYDGYFFPSAPYSCACTLFALTLYSRGQQLLSHGAGSANHRIHTRRSSPKDANLRTSTRYLVEALTSLVPVIIGVLIIVVVAIVVRILVIIVVVIVRIVVI